MGASDSPGTTMALAFADARMRFSFFFHRSFGFGRDWLVGRSAGDGDGLLMYLRHGRVGWSGNWGSGFGSGFARGGFVSVF